MLLAAFALSMFGVQMILCGSIGAQLSRRPRHRHGFHKATAWGVLCMMGAAVCALLNVLLN